MNCRTLLSINIFSLNVNEKHKVDVYYWCFLWGLAEKFIGWPRYSHGMDQMRFIFQLICSRLATLQSSHFFHQCWSVWIPLAIGHQQQKFSSYKFFSLSLHMSISKPSGFSLKSRNWNSSFYYSLNIGAVSGYTTSSTTKQDKDI